MDLMRKKLIASALSAAAATTLTQTGAAQADSTEWDFGDPAKNVACGTRLYPDGENWVQCDIGKHTWVGPDSAPCAQDVGATFMLREAGAPEISCFTAGQVLPTIYYVLGYGQTRATRAITCDSETSGITCTNTNTKHFFRVSRDSYQVG